MNIETEQNLDIDDVYEAVMKEVGSGVNRLAVRECTSSYFIITYENPLLMHIKDHIIRVIESLEGLQEDKED
tara:strand:+ start:1510 stop:1725 length:216 start_codon:yes stop_codon:yes gene_type:complete